MNSVFRSGIAIGLVSAGLLGCAKAPDPLAGRWDVADPESAAKGAVTVTDFADGKFTSERRGEVLGIGKLSVTTKGTYEISEGSVAMTNTSTAFDASAIADPKIRAATVRVAEGMAKPLEGKKRTYVLKVQSPDQVTLAGELGNLTLHRAR